LSANIAQPPVIKNNFIYRHVWNNIHTRDLNATFCIVGTPGKGKSTLGLKMCEDLDPTFTTDRVCYSVVDMVRLLAIKGKDRLKPGSCILFDEIVNEQGGYSRTALSKHNQIMNFVVANMRARRIVLIICLPKFTQLDKDIREVGLTGVFQMQTINREKQMSKSKFKWMTVDEMTGNVMSPFPRLLSEDGMQRYKVKAVWFKRPSKELEKAYKQKKKEYMQSKVEKWLGMLTNEKGEAKLTHAKDIADKILLDPKKFQTDGKFDYIKIIGEFEVGDQKARNIQKLAESLIV